MSKTEKRCVLGPLVFVFIPDPIPGCRFDSRALAQLTAYEQIALAYTAVVSLAALAKLGDSDDGQCLQNY